MKTTIHLEPKEIEKVLIEHVKSLPSIKSVKTESAKFVVDEKTTGYGMGEEIRTEFDGFKIEVEM